MGKFPSGVEWRMSQYRSEEIQDGIELEEGKPWELGADRVNLTEDLTLEKKGFQQS